MLRFDDLMLGSLEIFCEAAEKQSFTLAAQSLGLTPAAVSRSIARLEKRLDAALFVRTTRRVRLTDAGFAYLVQCRPALAQLAEAERVLAGTQEEPSGLIRLSMATPYAQYRLLPLLAAFQRENPAIRFDIDLSNHNIDFTSDAFDLAVRSRQPPESGLVARKLEDAELAIVAAPGYLAAHGEPLDPDELDRHSCIQFLLPSTGQPIPWSFRLGDADSDRTTQGKMVCSNDPGGCAVLAREGAGLLQTYRFMVDGDIRNGRLVEVLRPYAGRSRPFSLLYPQNRHMPGRLKALVTYLINGVRAAAQMEKAASRPPLQI